jgi:hypothetical protein
MREEVAMVPVMSLWLPILLSAVLVFVVSSIIHMMLTYHRTDYSRLPDEEKVLDALRPLNVPPGEYIFPHAGSMAAMKDPAYAEKLKRGPVGMLTLRPTGAFNMGGSLAMWFVYSVVVSAFAAYVTSRAVDPGADYLAVFRFSGTVAFAGYSLALLQGSIWSFRRWSTTWKSVFDGLVYALLTAGVFGWLWPR